MKTIIEPQKTLCPVCGGSAVRLESRSGWFWKCLGSCGKFFSDEDGQIVQPVKCLECGEYALERFESQKMPGVFFWRCASCKVFYQDKSGFPGVKFGDEETTQCPNCGGKAVRKVSNETDEWYWHCECGDYRDSNGKIGATLGERVQ